MSDEAIDQKFVHVPRYFLIVSASIHFAIPMLFMAVAGLEKLGIHLFPTKKLNTIEMYQNFIQVDVVGLPDELMNQKNEMDATLPITENPSVAPEVKAADDPEAMHLAEEKKAADLKAKKSEELKKAGEAEKKAHADKDKALKQLERQAEKEAALNALKDNGGKKGRTKISGNLKSQGTAMSGKVGTAKDRYSALVAQKVREHFNIFPWQKKKGLAASVYIEITSTGRVKDKKLMKASRDPVYDAAVLQAVEASQPFPVPEDMSLVSDGINLEFKPEN